MANNQHKAFYGEHLASVYDNSDPYGAQGRQPTNHSSPPPQHQPQYYAQPQSTPGQGEPARCLCLGWELINGYIQLCRTRGTDR